MHIAHFATLTLTTLTLAAPGVDRGEDELVFAGAPVGVEVTNPIALRLAPLVAVVEAEYAALTAELGALHESLRVVKTPASMRQQFALHERLSSIDALRRRLHARLSALESEQPLLR